MSPDKSMRGSRRTNGSIEQMLREHQALSGLPPHTLRAVAWSFGYLDLPTPPRDDFRRAFASVVPLGKGS